MSDSELPTPPYGSMQASCPTESTVVDFLRPLLLCLTSGQQALSPVPEEPAPWASPGRKLNPVYRKIGFKTPSF